MERRPGDGERGGRPRYDRRMTQQTGRVLAIHITAEAEGDLAPVPSIRAHPGKGLEGDRYFNSTGTFAKAGKPLHRVAQAASFAAVRATRSPR